MPFVQLLLFVMLPSALPVGAGSTLLLLGWLLRDRIVPPLPERHYAWLAAWFFAPLALITLSACWYGADKRTDAAIDFGTVFSVLALAVALGITVQSWRARNHWWVAAPVWALGLFFTAMSWFIGAMAIADDWI